jgi:pyruvate/2-oxoglutarate dehydrogenase complex dihydrolipoamide acyltransferase (E2) component
MVNFIRIPTMNMGMEEGAIVEWLVANGTHVVVGQPIYVLSSDKVETEIECQVNGTITILLEAGATCPVGTPIAKVDGT